MSHPEPRFPIGGPTRTTWREHALARSRELRNVAIWVRETRGSKPQIEAAVASVFDHLDAADQAANDDHTGRRGYSRAKVWIGGASEERAASNLDAAESETLNIASLEYVRGQLPNLLAHVRAHLPADDPRRLEVERIATSTAPFGEVERGAVVGAVRNASVESRREITRVRSFRNILYVSALLLSIVAVALVLVGIFNPKALPLCFAPGNEVVCPTNVADVGGPVGETPPVTQVDPVVRDTAAPWDIIVVTFVGLIAAAVAAAASLKDIKGSSTPYSLPTALAVLKLPTGALTAFLGLELMRGEFVPGLSALDSPAQIIAWAIVFGYAQQLFTGLVDRQAQGVLDEVGNPNQPPASPAPADTVTVVTGAPQPSA
jgi:hypothetical protein